MAAVGHDERFADEQQQAGHLARLREVLRDRRRHGGKQRQDDDLGRELAVVAPDRRRP
jgi:hypothetical protein